MNYGPGNNYYDVIYDSDLGSDIESTPHDGNFDLNENFGKHSPNLQGNDDLISENSYDMSTKCGNSPIKKRRNLSNHSILGDRYSKRKKGPISDIITDLVDICILAIKSGNIEVSKLGQDCLDKIITTDMNNEYYIINSITLYEKLYNASYDCIKPIKMLLKNLKPGEKLQVKRIPTSMYNQADVLHLTEKTLILDSNSNYISGGSKRPGYVRMSTHDFEKGLNYSKKKSNKGEGSGHKIYFKDLF